MIRLRRLFSRLALHAVDSRTVLQLAYPVVLGSLSYTLLSVTDTAMLGRLGAVPLAASGVAGVLFFAVVFPLSSVSVGVQTLASRRFGEQRYAGCGQILHTGLLAVLALGVPLAVLAPWIAGIAAPALSNDSAVIELGRGYLQYRLLGAGFMFANWVFGAFFAAVGRTQHQMIASIVVTVSNIALDYVLIFGHLGAPAMGIIGAAVASTIATGIGAVYYLVITLRPRIRDRFSTFRRDHLTVTWVWPMIRLSLPIVGQRILSHGSWFVFFLVVARIGTVELAASNVIRSIYSLTIMIAAGLGTASAALVGHRMGAGEHDTAERLAWESTRLAAYSMGLLGLLFLLIPGWVFRIYTGDLAVIEAGMLPLRILGLVQAFAGITLVLSSSLQGSGNTRFVLLAELAVCSTLYLPVVYFFGLHTSLGLVGAWMGEYFYWIALAIIMSVKFAQGSWKHIQV